MHNSGRGRGRGRRRGRVGRLLLAAAMVGVALLTVEAGVMVYDRLAHPYPDEPAVRVRIMLYAVLVEPDPAAVNALICPTWSADEVGRTFRVTADPQAHSNWGELSVRQDGDHADVIVRMTTTIDMYAQVDVWRVHLSHVRSRGWQICSAERVEPPPDL